MVILAFSPHPDDVEFGCFGTLAILSRSEKVVIVVVTSGAEGGAPPEVRESEAESAGRLISARVDFMRLRDGYIAKTPETVDAIRDIIREISPRIVFAPSPRDRHQDHVIVSDLITSAVLMTRSVMFYQTPSSDSFTPNVFNDITTVMDLKLEALSRHKSQIDKPYFDADQIRAMGSYRAWEIHRPGSFFEGFSLYSCIVEDGTL